jgi:hypothetical protein
MMSFQPAAQKAQWWLGEKSRSICGCGVVRDSTSWPCWNEGQYRSAEEGSPRAAKLAQAASHAGGERLLVGVEHSRGWRVRQAE